MPLFGKSAFPLGGRCLRPRPQTDEGKPAGYFVVFCICAVAYLVGWIVMKTLVPKYKPIVLD